MTDIDRRTYIERTDAILKVAESNYILSKNLIALAKAILNNTDAINRRTNFS